MSSRPLHRKFHVSRNSTNLVGTSVLSSNFSGISFRACRFTSSHWPSNGVLRIPVFVFFFLLLSEPVPDFSRKLSCKHAGIDHRKGWLKALVLTSCPEFALSNVSYLKHITPSNICKCLKLSILLLRNIAYEMRLRHLFWIFFLYSWLLVAFNTMQKSLCVCRKELAAGFARYALQNAAYYFTGEDAEQTYQCEKQSSAVKCLLVRGSNCSRNRVFSGSSGAAPEWGLVV